jgi:hypothetical protein
MVGRRLDYRNEKKQYELGPQMALADKMVAARCFPSSDFRRLSHHPVEDRPVPPFAPCGIVLGAVGRYKVGRAQ